MKRKCKIFYPTQIHCECDNTVRLDDLGHRIGADHEVILIQGLDGRDNI